jgi:hypothetical protein
MRKPRRKRVKADTRRTVYYIGFDGKKAVGHAETQRQIDAVLALPCALVDEETGDPMDWPNLDDPDGEHTVFHAILMDRLDRSRVRSLWEHGGCQHRGATNLVRLGLRGRGADADRMPDARGFRAAAQQAGPPPQQGRGATRRPRGHSAGPPRGRD